ncbi:MAG: TIM barrel protein [Nitrososphaerota archaeon]|nr:sugar phosphate isomerase/epimerase [Candidatus Bathyarchaeota archaeon]MDW8048425.1 TIM barrel protein [Nitrososphaerota archaeon]
MRKSWSEVVSLGIVHPMIYPETLRGEGPILETLSKIVADDSFGAIEVSWIKDIEIRTKVASILDSAYMDVVYCAGPPILMQKLDLNSFDEKTRMKAIEGVKSLVDEAYMLGAKIMAIASGPDVEARKRSEARNLLQDSLKKICEYARENAKDYILMISLENFDRDYDKKLLVGPTAEAADVVKSVREEYENIGLTVDLSHLPLLHETPKQSLTAAAKYLEHVHVGNCILKDKNHPQYGDQHPRLGIKGGENSVKELIEFLKILKEIGYFDKKAVTKRPVISFEVKPSSGESSEAIIAGSKRMFAEAWSKI